jgi:hypothetical protein
MEASYLERDARRVADLQYRTYCHNLPVGYWCPLQGLTERFHSHANDPMLAQVTACDIYARGIRSRAATRSDPQAAFALAHVPTLP